MKERPRRILAVSAIGLAGLGIGWGANEIIIDNKEEVTLEPTARNRGDERSKNTNTDESPHTAKLNLQPGQIVEVSKAKDALAYPTMQNPDPLRQPVFPDVPYGSRPALAGYESPFEDGDYFEDGRGDIDLPQYYYRVMTAGKIKIPQLGVDCVSTEEKGCAVILINHFGPTAMFRNDVVDNGFTIAGRVWDMSTPELVTETGQALVDHYMGRMTDSTEGANCSTIDACKDVEWHVVVVGNGKPQAHWAGLFHKQ